MKWRYNWDRIWSNDWSYDYWLLLLVLFAHERSSFHVFIATVAYIHIIFVHSHNHTSFNLAALYQQDLRTLGLISSLLVINISCMSLTGWIQLTFIGVDLVPKESTLLASRYPRPICAHYVAPDSPETLAPGGCLLRPSVTTVGAPKPKWILSYRTLLLADVPSCHKTN